MSNKMALDALQLAYIAMQHMGNVLNNIDAVDEEEDAQHDAAFEAVRAAIAALQAEPQGWRPIETAPKDEATYFLATNGSGVWVAHWQPVAGSGYRFDNPWRTVMLNHWHIEDKQRRYDPPTHWMPLPSQGLTMSCPHGNHPDGCERCAEIADHERAYELLFTENAKLRAEVERLAAQSAPTDNELGKRTTSAATARSHEIPNGSVPATQVNPADQRGAPEPVANGGDARGASGGCARPTACTHPACQCVAQSAPLQQAAEPPQEFESAQGRALASAWAEGWAQCRDAEFVGEEAEHDAFNQSATLAQCLDADRAAAQVEPSAPPAPGGDALAAMKARKDAAYEERNKVVAALAKLFPSGIAKTAIEGWSEDWHGCVYIDLPTGQVSWHFHDSQAYLFAGLPAYAGQWDGHDTPEKYRRLAALQSTQAPTAAAQGQTPSADIFANAIRADWNMEPSTPDEALELLDAMDAEYAKTMGKPAPDDEMAVAMRRVRHMACDLWAWQKEAMRENFTALAAAQPSQAPVVQAVQAEYCTACDSNQICPDCPRRASSGATTQAVRMLTPEEPEKCYSLDEETFYDLGDLIDMLDEEQAKPGILVYEGESVRHKASHYARGAVANLFERMGEQAFDDAGEHIGDWPDHAVKDDNLAEFEKLIYDWLDANVKVHFYTVKNVRQIALTADMLGDDNAGRAIPADGKIGGV